jgi:hypothetical protein
MTDIRLADAVVAQHHGVVGHCAASEFAHVGRVRRW